MATKVFPISDSLPITGALLDHPFDLSRFENRFTVPANYLATSKMVDDGPDVRTQMEKYGLNLNNKLSLRSTILQLAMNWQKYYLANISEFNHYVQAPMGSLRFFPDPNDNPRLFRFVEDLAELNVIEDSVAMDEDELKMLEIYGLADVTLTDLTPSMKLYQVRLTDLGKNFLFLRRFMNH